MSQGVETLEVVEPWLYGVLSGDAELVGMVGADNIVGTLSVGEVPGRYVVFSHSSNRDILGTGAVRTEVDCIYAVKAVALGASWDPVLPIAKRLDALLSTANRGTVTTAAGALTCTRESTVQYPEVVEGAQYRHLGALWRIRANSA